MSVHRLFTMLALAARCLGGGRIANAASVTGSGIDSDGSGAPLTIAVSAMSGPSGPQGLLRVGQDQIQMLGRVTDVVVVGNVGVVEAQITRSTQPGAPVGWYLVFWVQDNGPAGEAFNGAPPQYLVSHDDLLQLASDIYFNPSLFILVPITAGHISVTP